MDEEIYVNLNKTYELDAPQFDKFVYADGKLVNNLGSVNGVYTCLRPSSVEACPYIALHKINKNLHSQSVISNFGHVGGGWTLNWITVIKSLELIKLTNQDKIGIIGGGLIGLTTAICLIEMGIPVSNITLYTDTIDITKTAGFGAGAIFSCQVRDPNVREDFDELILNNFKIWNNIMNSKSKPNENPFESTSFPLKFFDYSEFSPFVNLVDFYTGNEKEVGLIDCNSGLDPVVKAKLVQKIEICKIKFKGEGNVTHSVKKIKTFFFDTYDLMTRFFDQLIERGLKVVERKVENVEDLNEQVVFNCTGAGAKQFKEFKDKAYAQAGHMITLKQSEINLNKKLNYIILSKYKQTKESPEEYFVYMPKSGPGFSYILGSSKLKDYYGGDINLDQKILKSIVNMYHSIFNKQPKIPKAKF